MTQRLLVALVLMLSLGFAFAAPVSSQVDRASCGHFETQEDAQAALDANPELATTLDNDGNGVACEELRTGGPVVVDPASCGHFETREDAQAALDANPEFAISLDNDGNGVACETLPKGTGGGTGNTDSGTDTSGASGRTIALPNTGAGVAAPASILPWILPAAALLFAFGGMLSLTLHSRRFSTTRI